MRPLAEATPAGHDLDHLGFDGEVRDGMVSINTFAWRWFARLRTKPLPSSAVMIAMVVTVVATADVAKGALVGVLLSRRTVRPLLRLRH